MFKFPIFANLTAKSVLKTPVFAAVFMLASCATAPKFEGYNKTYFSSRLADKSELNFMLGPDDELNIAVDKHPEWSGKFLVKPDGNIIIPNLAQGEFKAEGITKEKLAANIAVYLENFINNPSVSIDLVKYASRVIYVFGEVNKPGKISTEGRNVTLRDAVLMAGLPTQYAALRRVFIVSPSNKNPKRRVVNAHKILYRGEMERNIQLNHGDVVFIPKTFLGVINHFLTMLLSPLSAASTAAAISEP